MSLKGECMLLGVTILSKLNQSQKDKYCNPLSHLWFQIFLHRHIKGMLIRYESGSNKVQEQPMGRTRKEVVVGGRVHAQRTLYTWRKMAYGTQCNKMQKGERKHQIS